MGLTYAEIVRDLDVRPIIPQKAPTLKPMREALDFLKPEFPKDLSRVIVVAGTNGKGTTCKTLETLLRGIGKKTALFISPHLVSYTERIQLDGAPVSEDHFVRAYEAISDIAKDYSLSHFEIVTAMAVWTFFMDPQIERPDYFIFEVGMGGTWDATNAIPHGVSVITAIGIDHVPVLGTTLEEIAKNKFGIVTDGQIVVCDRFSESGVMAVAEDFRKKTSGPWSYAPNYETVVDHTESVPKYILKSKWGPAPISMLGDRACENMNLALTVFAELGFDPREGFHSLSRVNWPGRMSLLSVEGQLCPIYYSGDHNPAGVKSLLKLLEDFKYDKIFLLVAIGKAKDADEMLELFRSIPRSTLLLTSASFMGRDRAAYGHWISNLDMEYLESPKQGLEKLVARARSQDLIVVTGSLYLYSDLMKS